MLITVEEFFEGGHSICRNRILQKMFIVFGRGERLGSGADIIRQGWKENNWPEPELKEHFGPKPYVWALFPYQIQKVRKQVRKVMRKR